MEDVVIVVHMVILEVEVAKTSVKENLIRVIETLIQQKIVKNKIIEGQMKKDQIPM